MKRLSSLVLAGAAVLSLMLPLSAQPVGTQQRPKGATSAVRATQPRITLVGLQSYGFAHVKTPLASLTPSRTATFRPSYAVTAATAPLGAAGSVPPYVGTPCVTIIRALF